MSSFWCDLSIPIRFYDYDFAKRKTILNKILILKTLILIGIISIFPQNLITTLCRNHNTFMYESLTPSFSLSCQQKGPVSLNEPPYIQVLGRLIVSPKGLRHDPHISLEAPTCPINATCVLPFKHVFASRINQHVALGILPHIHCQVYQFGDM